MKAIDSRIRRLQQQLCPNEGQEQRLWVLVKPSYGLALDQDRCVQILEECGFLPKTRFGIVDLCGIPEALNARELEKYLRTNGTQAPGFGADQQQSVPSRAMRLGEGAGSNQAQIASDCVRC